MKRIFLIIASALSLLAIIHVVSTKPVFDNLATRVKNIELFPKTVVPVPTKIEPEPEPEPEPEEEEPEELSRPDKNKLFWRVPRDVFEVTLEYNDHSGSTVFRRTFSVTPEYTFHVEGRPQ